MFFLTKLRFYNRFCSNIPRNMEYINGNGTTYTSQLKHRELHTVKNGMDGSVSNGYNGSKSVDDFLKDVMDMAMQEGFRNVNRKTPVVRFKNPDELKKIIDLELRDEGQDHESLLAACRDVFKYSVRTGHPHFFNQLYAGLDPYGFAGQILTDVLNTSVYTYEVAPVFVLMENELLKHMLEIIGFEEGDGTFCPGGSYSNLMGMHLARFWKFPDIKEKGLRRLPRMVVFTSKHGHYSVSKNASLIGLPSDDVIKVKCDDRGRICCEDLEQKILSLKAEGAVPFLVNATAGTTVLGAFDPLENIADLCQKHGLWMHVDAAWGGSALMSQKYKYLCNGIGRANSVTWNQHKMMMAPLQCSAFVTRHPAILKDCNSIAVPYLFQQDKKSYDTSFDIGSKILQCGRKVDSLKLWLLWKAKGNNGIAKQVEKAFENARYLTEKVRETPGFQLVLEEPECTNVCFWYIPPRMRNVSRENWGEKYKRELSGIAPLIKERMVACGSMLVGHQVLDDKPNFFRMVVINDQVNSSDMDFVIEEIDRLGKNL